ncbi:ABC transporter permease [Chloroflexota bacterium]
MTAPPKLDFNFGGAGERSIVRAYIIRRVLLIIPTFLMVTLIVFIMIRLVPGHVVDLMAEELVAESDGVIVFEEAQAKITAQLGFDMPVHIQYFRWMQSAIQGDLGTSLWGPDNVAEELGRRIPVTLELGILGAIVALIIALPIGTYSAIRQDTLGDYGARTLAVLCISLPGFWVATLVIVYPSIWWDWTPPLVYVPFAENPMGNLIQFILPAIVMGMYMSGTTMRMTRTMMLEVMRQDYIRTAWAKGLREGTVIIRHALKNAMIPVVTVVGLQVPILVGGSVVLESIFGLPGLGLLLIQSIHERDYPFISGINLILAGAILVVNLLVDLTYAYLDPRIRYQ